jgi:hypothetical protein
MSTTNIASLPDSLKIVCSTWNVNSQDPDIVSTNIYPNGTSNETGNTRIRSPLNNQLIIDLRNLLQMDKLGEADVYAIGLQEIDMSARAMLKEETEQMWKWEHTLHTVFETTQNKYKQICMIQLVGICLVVFVRREHFRGIKGLRHYIMREGFVGLGNKGSIALRFDLFGSSFCFINMHLAAHTQNLLQRNQSLNSILAKTHFSFGQSNYSVNKDDMFQVKTSVEDEIFVSRADMYVKDHDFTFLMGDFNYRITNDHSNFSFDEIRRKVEDKRWTVLRMCDQLTNEMKRGRILVGYTEGNIDFAPTYKYLPGTNDYACEEAKQKKRDLKHGIIRSEKSYGDANTGKERIPSWTDRIFYRCNIDGVEIQQLYYGRTESLLSDHKPVSSVFVVPLGRSVHHDEQLTGEDTQMRRKSSEHILDDAPKMVTKKPPPPPAHLLNKTSNEDIAGNRNSNRNTTLTKKELLSLDDFFSSDEDASSSVTPLSDSDDGAIQPLNPALPPVPVIEPPPLPVRYLQPTMAVQSAPQTLTVQPQIGKRSASLGRQELPQVPILQPVQQQPIQPPAPPQRSSSYNSLQKFDEPQQPHVPVLQSVQAQPSISQQYMPQQQKPPVVMRPNMKDMRQAQRAQQYMPQQPVHQQYMPQQNVLTQQSSQYVPQQPQLPPLPNQQQQGVFDPFGDDELDWSNVMNEVPMKPSTQFYVKETPPMSQQQQQQPVHQQYMPQQNVLTQQSLQYIPQQSQFPPQSVQQLLPQQQLPQQQLPQQQLPQQQLQAPPAIPKRSVRGMVQQMQQMGQQNQNTGRALPIRPQ